jgi:uncharacterized protein involved in type VI secretion and phage assembly
MTAQPGTCDFGEQTERRLGIYPGVVESVLDENGKSLITVKLHWLDEDDTAELRRVAQIHAGNGYGAHWLPEKGDQVVVAFLKGDLRNPVILGSLYADVRVPHLTRSGTADPKYFRTKAGHMLLMEDKDGKRIEIVDLTTKNSIIIDSEANTIAVKADADVSVTATKGNVAVNAKGNVTAEAQGDISATARGNITLDAGGNITISASGTVTVSGATINLN